MKKNIFIIVMGFVGLVPAMAQDTYENARLLGNDLNGTARYVGMGGALEALGADISTISTNPAGIGLFRHSTAGLSFGAVSQQDATKFDHLGKTNMSFDQVGFVYANRTGESSFVNFAFNYHKSRNFDQILSAANKMHNEASLNKLVWGKSTLGSDRKGGYSLDTNSGGEWMGWRDATSNERAYPYTQLDYLYTNAVTMEDYYDNQGRLEDSWNTYMAASNYDFNRAHRGWISDYDFNISGNANDRVYWGISVGIHDVTYEGYSAYEENIVDSSRTARGTHRLLDERKIDGTGVDLKFGLIFRPIAESPFRVGLSVSTPTWYDLRSSNYTVLENRTDADFYTWGADEYKNGETLDFKYYTPWKFGLSLGHTVSNYLALGASYEFMSAGSASTLTQDDFGYNEWSDDREMNDNTDFSLKGVHTLKLGAEVKVDPSLSVRLGYNYQSAMYEEGGVRDLTLDSETNAYASTADYTNWEGTNRITCGLGYKTGGFNFDIAYQYSTTNGTFYPFQSKSYNKELVFTDPADGSMTDNVPTPSSVSFKRHQVLFTVGYTF